jgi:Flp pilus assembly pilin Flp
MRFGTPRHGVPRRRARRIDRGATLVEYSLGIALLCVASLGGINALQSSLASNVEDHGASAGAPDLPDAGIPTTTATTSTPTTPQPPTTPVPSVTATGNVLATRVGAANNNKWNPSVDISARDTATGNTLQDATITVSWTYTTKNGQTQTETPDPCDAPSTGVCSFQLTGLNSNGGQCVASVTFTVTAITSDSQTVTYTSGSTFGSITGPTTCP